MLIANLLSKKERVLLVCVITKAPSLSMVIRRCCLLALFLANKLSASLVLVQLLLLLSGDVETNPGPTTGELRCCTCASCVGVTIYSLIVPAKPVGNLSLRMFQRYFARMANALKECPGVVANDLYSNHLIARETVDKVHLTLGLTPHDKATILLMAVEPGIADSKSDKALRKLCGILAKHPNMRKLSNHIMKRYGKLYKHM